MEFEVFTRKTEPRLIRDVPPSLSFYGSRGAVSINAAAARMLELKAGDRIAFLKKDKTWFLAKTEDPSGYKLSLDKSRPGFKFTSQALFETICGRDRSANHHFYLQQTSKKYEGRSILELLKRPALQKAA